jgi:hypothetical protein
LPSPCWGCLSCAFGGPVLPRVAIMSSPLEGKRSIIPTASGPPEPTFCATAAVITTPRPSAAWPMASNTEAANPSRHPPSAAARQRWPASYGHWALRSSRDQAGGRVVQERARREGMWASLRAAGGPDGLTPRLLRGYSARSASRAEPRASGWALTGPAASTVRTASR